MKKIKEYKKSEDIDNEKNLGRLIVDWAEKRHDDPFALFSHTSPITGEELNLASGRLAFVLANRGLGLGSKATLLFRPGKELLVSLLACWKLGVMVSPIDSFISTSQLPSILTVLKPDLILLDPGFEKCSDLRKVSIHMGCSTLEVSLDNLDGEVLSPADYSYSPNEVALCLFTSGSTGLPKGVSLTHSALLEGARNLLAAKNVGQQDRVLCVLPLSHLNGLVTTFISPLLSLGSAVYMQDSFTPEGALHLIDEYKCTWFSAVPTHYMMMLSPPQDKDKWSLKSLKFCRSASAPLSTRVLLEFENHYGVPIIETMGTTETAGQIFSNPLAPGKRKPGSVGIPVGFEVRLMAKNDTIEEPYCRGEIQVRGKAMMSGYLDDLEETSKAFDEDWFKTGDIAEFDQEGFYYIKGRIKDIAIFCGLNISLRAIEMASIDAKIVKDAACIASPHPMFGETVIMYATLLKENDEPATVSKLIRDQASKFLPNEQAMSEIRFIKSFPRSPVGKVLKGRLEEQEVLFSSREQMPIDPKSLLASVLDIPKDNITEDLMMWHISEWDSLRYVSLIAATENILGRNLNRKEISALVSFKGLKAVLSRKLELIEESQKGFKDRKNHPVTEIISKLKDAGFGSFKTSYIIIGYDYCASIGAIDVEELLSALQEEVMPDRNLVMNTFTWKFCKGESYHHRYSRCEVGLLNELFRLKPKVIRVSHPIYSYAVLGPDAETIAKHESETCWGDGSVTMRLLKDPEVHVTTFGLMEHKGSQLRANPALHSLEELFRVPYRYFKTFHGQVNFGEGFSSYSTKMYVRPLDVTVQTTWRPIAEILASRGLDFSDKRNRLYSYMNRDIFLIGKELLNEDNTLMVKNREVINHPLLQAEVERWTKKDHINKNACKIV